MTYEHTVREIDALSLMSIYLYELEIPNLIADIVFSRREKFLTGFPSIIVIPFMHSRYDWIYTTGFFERAFGKLPLTLNMHWEQLGTANSQTFLAPKDDFARNVYHVSWSDQFTRFLIEEGKVRSNLIWQTGNPKADFLSNEFCSSYIDKASFYERLDIPEKASVILFIMSFSSAFVSEKYIANVETKGGYSNYRDFVKLSTRSLELSLNEIKGLAKMMQRENAYVVLRPHPMTPIQEIKKVMVGQENIRVSREFPLHEVIYHSEGVVSWLSTGTIDAYVFNRPTVILRPNKIPQEFDFDMLNGFARASNANEAYEVLKNKPTFKRELLDKYVSIIYGSLDGNNTVNLAKKIKDLYDSLVIRLDQERKIGWWKEGFKYITKDIPKNLLADYAPCLLPRGLKGRLDDKYNDALVRKMQIKYLDIASKKLRSEYE